MVKERDALYKEYKFKDFNEVLIFTWFYIWELYLKFICIKGIWFYDSLGIVCW